MKNTFNMIIPSRLVGGLTIFLHLLTTLALATDSFSPHKASNSNCAELKNSLQQIIDQAVKDGLPGVSLAVRKKGCELIEVSSGLADLSKGSPMTAQANVRLASGSKPFVGVLIMQLVEAGQLSLNDPIAKYLPAEIVNNLRNGNKATLRQLMNHTSGLADYFDNRFTTLAAKEPGKLYVSKEAVKFAFGKPPAFSPPGTGYFYSNTNTVLLGMIIEKVLDAPLSKTLRDRIFTPLKMENSFCETDQSIKNLTRGYFFTGAGERIDYTDINQGYGLPDGIVISNARDMSMFIRSLLTEEVLLKQKTVNEMLVIDPAAKRAQEGLNLFIFSRYQDRGYGKMIGHVGEYGGYKSEMYYFPQQDAAFVMLTNSSGRGINQRWSELFEEVVTAINGDNAK